jgi:hypothetical protein
MFDVQVMSASPSQNPMVSPYHCGASGPRWGTAPSILNDRPMWTLVMKLSASPARNCTSVGVTITECGWLVTAW